MGFFGGIGKAIKGVGRGVGKVAGKIGNVARKIPIVGNAVATPFSLAEGVGRLVGGQNSGAAFKNFGLGALETAAIVGGAGLGGVGPAASLGSKFGTAGAASKLLHSPVAGKIGAFVKKQHPLDVAQLALSGVGTVQGAQRAGAADQLRSQAFAGLDPNATIDLSGQLPQPYRRKAPLKQIAREY